MFLTRGPVLHDSLQNLSYGIMDDESSQCICRSRLIIDHYQPVPLKMIYQRGGGEYR